MMFSILSNRRRSRFLHLGSGRHIGVGGLMSIVMLFRITSVWAQPDVVPVDASDATTRSPEAEKMENARRFFDAGAVFYREQNFFAALESFRKGYDLVQAPAMLFNIAQAHRMLGQCAESLAAYQNFLVAIHGTDFRIPIALEKVKELSHICPAVAVAEPENELRPAAVPSLVLNTTDPNLTPSTRLADGKTPLSSTYERTSLFLAVGGGAALIASVGLYVWNDGRYDEWRLENSRLRSAMPSDLVDSEFLKRQTKNDGLSRSIRNAQSWNVVVAVSGIALVVSSVVVRMVEKKSGDSQVSWTGNGLYLSF
jgi:hypothetical protein